MEKLICLLLPLSSLGYGLSGTCTSAPDAEQFVPQGCDVFLPGKKSTQLGRGTSPVQPWHLHTTTENDCKQNVQELSQQGQNLHCHHRIIGAKHQSSKQGDTAVSLTFVMSLRDLQTRRTTGEEGTGLGAIRQDRQKSSGPPKKIFIKQGLQVQKLYLWGLSTLLV